MRRQNYTRQRLASPMWKGFQTVRLLPDKLRREAELDRVHPEIILITPVDHLLAHCERKTRRARNDAAVEARINFCDLILNELTNQPMRLVRIREEIAMTLVGQHDEPGI